MKSFTSSGIQTFTFSYTCSPGSLRAGSRALPLLWHRPSSCSRPLRCEPGWKPEGNWPWDKNGTWGPSPTKHTWAATVIFLTFQLLVFRSVFPFLHLSVGWMWVWLLLHLRFCSSIKRIRKTLKSSNTSQSNLGFRTAFRLFLHRLHDAALNFVWTRFLSLQQ